QEFSGRFDYIKSEINELGDETQAEIQKIKTPSNESAENKERERIMERFQEKRGNALTRVMTSEVVSNGLDLVPFAGGGKMLLESVSRKTLSGQELKGRDRVIHAAIGAG